MRIKQLICAAFALISVISAIAQGSFQINGHIDGGPEGIKVSLKYADMPDSQILCSAVLHNGDFELKGHVAPPRFCSIEFGNQKYGMNYDNKVLNLFVENSPIAVQACYDSLYTVYSIKRGALGIERRISVKGSASHDLLVRYLDKEPEQIQRWLSAQKDLAAFKLSSDQGNQPKEQGMKLAAAFDEAAGKMKAFVMRFVKDNPPGAATAFIAYRIVADAEKHGLRDWFTSHDIDELTAPFAAMADKGAIVKALLQSTAALRKAAPGAPFIDFAFIDTSGQKHTLGDFAGKGHYVLLDFWASTCGPCRKEIPHLKEAYARYHQKGFDIVSISLDRYEDHEKWMKAERMEKMPWTQLLPFDLSKAPPASPKKNGFDYYISDVDVAYIIDAIPLFLLFDPGGRLVARKQGGGPWIDKMMIDLYGNN